MNDQVLPLSKSQIFSNRCVSMRVLCEGWGETTGTIVSCTPNILALSRTVKMDLVRALTTLMGG